MTGLERAVLILGGQTATGRILDVDQRTVWDWLNLEGKSRKKGDPPAQYVRALVKATANAVGAHELRPDIFPPPKETA